MNGTPEYCAPTKKQAIAWCKTMKHNPAYVAQCLELWKEKYGLVKGEQEAEPTKPAPDGYGHWYTCLYPGWFQNETVMKAFNVNDKEAAQSVIKGGIYAHFGINSMADLQPERFARLMCDRGLYWTLPSLLRVLKIGGEAA